MSNRKSDLPKARTECLVTKEVDDEVLIYDTRTDKAHCLNSTAAFIWQRCDGQTNIEEIAKSLMKQTGTAIDENVVWLGLDQLKSFGLLEVVPAKPAAMAGMTRRQMVRHVGAAALALPVIISIAAPVAGQAASPCMCTRPNCRIAGCPCSNPGDCVRGTSCQSGICAP